MTGIKTDDGLSDLAGTGPAPLTGQSAARAFCNYTGLTTSAIQNSLSTSSLTDNGTGDTTIDWSVTFATSDYPCIPNCHASATTGDHQRATELDTISTTATRFVSVSTASTSKVDLYRTSCVAHGDLA